jgi:hypothetical protein
MIFVGCHTKGEMVRKMEMAREMGRKMERG